MSSRQHNFPLTGDQEGIRQSMYLNWLGKNQTFEGLFASADRKEAEKIKKVPFIIAAR